MLRVELLNAGGFRVDGRKQYELRSIAIQLGGSQDTAADGSAQITQGLTIVSATVFGPREARSGANVIHDRASLNVEVSLAPWGSMERRRRNRGDRRLLEFASSIKSTFEPVIHTHLYPRSQIDIFVQVHQQDGGVLPAAINASTLALLDASIAMHDFVASVSCGIHSTSAMLDLSNTEEQDLPHLTVAVLPRTKQVTLASLETRLHVERFEQIFTLAIEAAAVLHNEMELAVRDRTKTLVQAMTGKAVEADTAVDEDDEGLDGRNHDDMMLV
ncbi:probable exosome complex exonuclease rrp41 [Sporisorium reilianum SRZ2]|uniref:Ribosomal RNA-processing protein 41 n=1 Tax=Sporisorium reilianum (strain SRZ2) TaxID=999809 RepID=E6ZSS6_SPORE|nr:probable exosome complex exonuclease rrp41 [Sporisorium reilianum SRZ2]